VAGAKSRIHARCQNICAVICGCQIISFNQFNNSSENRAMLFMQMRTCLYGIHKNKYKVRNCNMQFRNRTVFKPLTRCDHQSNSYTYKIRGHMRLSTCLSGMTKNSSQA
jgi:hypothetical protein